MEHRINKVGLVVSAAAALIAVVTFIFLNLSFEGPSLIAQVGDDYRAKATLESTEGMTTKQPVLLRGVEVGRVKEIDFNRERSNSTVEFEVGDEYAPIYKDATVAVGERTILGDSYLRLDPGTERAGELPSGGEVEGLPSVDFDEALDFLDETGRGHVRSLLRELEDATRSESNGARLSGTLAELSRTVREIRGLTDTLRGQEDNLAGLVRDSAIVLEELGGREDALRAIVGSGRTTLDALAANSRSLDRGLAEVPPLLRSGTRVLADARPLLREAGPLVRELRRAAPELEPVLADLPSITTDTVDVVSELSGLPSMRKLLQVVESLGPAIPAMEAAARNLVPLLRFTAPRARGIAAFFANLAGATAHGDSVGRWARFAFPFPPGELVDQPLPATCEPEDDVAANTGLCHNAYPEPDDPLDNEPYERGSYPRLRPFDPPKP